jgi:PadR family transcriptional regulator, regulatory protein AphA
MSRRLTTTEHAVLGLLAACEASGYDLAGKASRSTGYLWAPSRSQIYKILPRLVTLGHATRRDVPQQGRPDKQLYRVTAEGQAALRTWVEEVEDEPEGGIAVFLLKLLFAWAAPPEAGRRQLEAYRALIARRLAEFEELERALGPDDPVHARIALRHGTARARATLAWAEEARRALEPAPSRRSRRAERR